MTQRALGYLSFHTSTDELIVFTALAGEAPTAHRLPITQAELGEETARFRRMFEPTRVNPRRPERTIDFASACALMARILAPARPLLDQTGSLIVTGHRHLHFFPVHLFGPADSPPLATSHSVGYVPNFNLFRALKQRKHAGLDASRCLAVAAAEDSEDVETNFAMAPSRFAQLVGGEMLAAGDATCARLLRADATAKVLYLSCHGHFDAATPLEAYLLLADREGRPSRSGTARPGSALTVRAILGLEVPLAALVILDACLTGVQELAPGDEPVGFPSAFLVNGANAVIASNWIVEQNCARLFMETLVRGWVEEELPLGGAMRQAHAETRAAYPHPFHWGAFSLHGDTELRWENLGASTKNCSVER